MKSMMIMFLVMIMSILIASLWTSFPFIKNSVHFVLNPTAGSLLNWNATFGMLIIVAIIGLIMTLVQKYGTDQETLRQMRREQKEAQEEMKKYKDNPAKLMEFNKKQFENMPRMFEITMKPLIYTFIPFVLFFRWFNDYFSVVEFKFFGFLSWFWFYLIFSIVFSSVFRKMLKAA